ncbi:hypothetical protein BH09ACT8_BH09ACT8_19290 [soil metagenome]
MSKTRRAITTVIVEGRSRSEVARDAYGNVALRVNGRLHHISIGRAHARTRVLMLIQDLDVRVINAATGELLRHFTIDPASEPSLIQQDSPSDKQTPRTISQ